MPSGQPGMKKRIHINSVNKSVNYSIRTNERGKSPARCHTRGTVGEGVVGLDTYGVYVVR